MGIKRKFANPFHSKRSLVFGPLPDCINCFARTLVIWAFFFEIFKRFRGLVRGFQSK